MATEENVAEAVKPEGGVEYPELTGDAFWIRKMRTLFRRLDSNGNGNLQVDQFIDIALSMIADLPKMESFHGDTLVNTVVELWFSYISPHTDVDTRNSGCLNESQFVDKMREILNTTEFKERFSELLVAPFFNAADTDNDGFLTISEFRIMMRAWKAPQREADIVFKMLDTSHSGKLDLPGFRLMMAEYLYSTDTKNKVTQLWGPLVHYKRPEDFKDLECGPFWEGKMRTMFRRMDVSGHGKLKCHDFIQIARGIIQRGHLNRQKGDAVMRALLNIWVRFIAVDKDGKHVVVVTEKEFLKNLREMINGKFRRGIDQFGWTFFKAVEVDGNGFISMQEYRNLQEAWRVTREEADIMFKVLDSDKDGMVCADEYLNAWCDYFLGEDTGSPYKAFFGPVIPKHEAR